MTTKKAKPKKAKPKKVSQAEAMRLMRRRVCLLETELTEAKAATVRVTRESLQELQQARLELDSYRIPVNALMRDFEKFKVAIVLPDVRLARSAL